MNKEISLYHDNGIDKRKFHNPKYPILVENDIDTLQGFFLIKGL